LNVYEVIPMEGKMVAHCTTPPLAILITILMLAGTSLAQQDLEVLHRFRGGSDGSAAYARVISDKAGNLYGTTAFGGTSGAGIAFELTKPAAPGDWTETVLYTFTGAATAPNPTAA
jgi:uncharacterized repeat protein (TIGR03803 family)